MKTAIEIYKYLPKTNCGKCGTASCFGFAVKLAAGQAGADDCPNTAASAREALREGERGRSAQRGTLFEQTLLSIRPTVDALDFAAAARWSGASLIDPNLLELDFLNRTYRVARDRILDSSGREPEPFLSILIYNHLRMPDPPAPSREWITFGSVPASHAKDKAWTGHVEDVIAKRFAGDTEGLKDACGRLGGKPASITGAHDAAYEFRFFPNYPVLLLFYDAVPDEGFPAQVKLLLDRNVDKYLDIESIVVLGEEFAGRMTESQDG